MLQNDQKRGWVRIEPTLIDVNNFSKIQSGPLFRRGDNKQSHVFGEFV